MEKEKRKRVPGEIDSVRPRAKQLFSYWQVEQRLGLSSNESNLAFDYFTERLIRTRKYEATSILSHPFASAIAAAMFLGGLKSAERMEKERQEAIEYIQESTKVYIEKNYATPEERKKARTIELAISNLVAEATPPSTTTEKLVNNMKLSVDQLNSWTAHWRPQLRPQMS